MKMKIYNKHILLIEFYKSSLIYHFHLIVILKKKKKKKNTYFNNTEFFQPSLIFHNILLKLYQNYVYTGSSSPNTINLNKNKSFSDNKSISYLEFH